MRRPFVHTALMVPYRLGPIPVTAVLATVALPLLILTTIRWGYGVWIVATHSDKKSACLGAPISSSGGTRVVGLCRDNRVSVRRRPVSVLPRLPLSYVPSCRRRKQPYDNRRIELISRKL